MNVDQAAFRDILNTKIERRVADRPHTLITTDLGEACTDSIQQETDYVISQKRSTLNGLIDISTS